MTNILVPTDFTPASLKIAEGALRSGNYEKCNLILFHAFEIPFYPQDLVGGYKDPSGELMTESFRQACRQLKEEYGKQVNKIMVRCMTGSTRVLFRNWAEANDIDLIYCPDTYYFKPVHERSVDPLYLFRKCGIPVVKNYVAREEQVSHPSYYTVIPVSIR